jgi:hypothetical protein
LKRLKQGKNVQNRDLQTWLGADGYAQYEQEWAAQKELRDELHDKPVEIIEYESRLKRANFTYNRADRYSQQGRHETAKRLFGQADTEFEGVLTYLQEIVAADPGLCVWFDRDTTWDSESKHSLHPEHVPQVVTSKSPFNRTKSGGILQRKLGKRDVKIMAIENELAGIKQAKSKTKGKAPKLRSVENLLKAVRDGD